MLKIACLDAIQALFGGLGYIQISIVLPQQFIFLELISTCGKRIPAGNLG